MTVSRPLRIMLSVLLAGIVATTLTQLLAARDGATRPERGPRDDQGGTPANGELLSRGMTWTVKVPQDASAIVPDRSEGVGTVTLRYDFEVLTATGNTFVVRAVLDGAAGPWVDGYRLTYVRVGNELVLRSVGLADQQPLPAANGRLIVGQNFPLALRIDSAPRSHVATKAELAASGLPPALPSDVRKAANAGSKPSL